MKLIENICYASKEDLKEITQLWDICFPESPEFTKWYFKNIFSLQNTLIYKENKKVVAMLQEIPVKFNSSKKATYIYGACTHPLYRKKSIMTKLLNRSFENDIKKEINLSILIPENKELFKFYEKFGYNKTTLIKKEIFKNDSCLSQTYDNDYIFKKASFSDIENINNLYNKVLCHSDFIVRNNIFWKNQIQMFNDLGGGCFCLYNAKNSNLLAYSFVWNEDVIQAQEICFLDDTAKHIICKNILNEFNLSKQLELNIYNNSGDYKACIKFHNSEIQKNTSELDYIINLLWN